MPIAPNHLALQIVISSMLLVGMFLLVRYGYTPGMRWAKKQENYYDRVLRYQLMLDVHPALAVWSHVGGVIAMFFVGTALMGMFFGVVLSAIFFFVPYLLIRHLEFKRRQKLEIQLVDGLASLASGVRAGLNLVQAMQLLVQNQRGPIQQEFAHILREYEMGMELNQAMRSASNRIGSPLYRLTFTAIEMHRIRGGDSGESMDRIADSVREIQKLEGKLDAITAQGRSQGKFLAAMPFVILLMLYGMMPEETTMLFTTMQGKLILLIAIGLIVGGYLWIKKIMQVDI